VHPGEMLIRHTKDGKSWWSHKLGDGTWCRGKPPADGDRWGHKTLSGQWTRGQ